MPCALTGERINTLHLHCKAFYIDLSVNVFGEELVSWSIGIPLNCLKQVMVFRIYASHSSIWQNS